MLVTTLGGLGLFLLGMVIMTTGIHEVAGSSLRHFLLRFTSTPLTGAMTGTAITAILQSSSATTVASVGFVAAGILSFPQALGIIFGANIGTTITGWMVALFGFKLHLGEIVLPIIFLGAIMKLFGRGKLASTGYAIAGFGLIFVGITYLQSGMTEMRDIINLENFSSDTITVRIQLLLLGVLFTVITQSSSAGVATTLTALHTSMINFEQAAALVIGMDLGTTVKAIVATIGTNLEARRTGFSHVIYNMFTAVGAFLLITPYILLWEWLAPGKLYNNAEIGLVAFHSCFNTLGVILVLPFAHPFAKLIIRLFPDHRTGIAQHFDPDLLKDPASALHVVQKHIPGHLIKLNSKLINDLSDKKTTSESVEEKLLHDTVEIRKFIEQIHFESEREKDWRGLIYCLHIFDHLDRLLDRSIQINKDTEITQQYPSLSGLHNEYRELIEQLNNSIMNNQWKQAEKYLKENAGKLSSHASSVRSEIIQHIGEGSTEIPEATTALDHIRDLRRSIKHLLDILKHYNNMIFEEQK